MAERVILVYPPVIIGSREEHVCLPPLGLAFLAAVLEQRGREVSILDAVIEDFENRRPIDKHRHYRGLSWPELKQRIASYGPTVVGISWLFSRQSETCLATARLVKEIDPNIITVVGGAHPSAVPVEVLSNPEVDYVIIGEGEESFLEFLNQFRSGVGEVDGIGFKRDGEIVINPKTRFIKDLNNLPMPARHLLPMERYFAEHRLHPSLAKQRPMSMVVTSRGCPYNCTFCSIHTIWDRRWRARSVDKVLEEIEHLRSVYGVQEIQFGDDNFSLNAKRVEAILDEMIRRDLGLTWRTPNGIAVRTLSEPLIWKMRESGCYALSLAIESGNDYILNKVIRKNLDLDKVRQVAGWARAAQISLEGFFVIGMPGDTRETIAESVNLAAELDLDQAGFFSAQPYPGTELRDMCEEKGYAKFEGTSQLMTSSASIETPSLSRQELGWLQRWAYTEFELRRRRRRREDLWRFSTLRLIAKWLVLQVVLALLPRGKRVKGKAGPEPV